MTRCVNTRMTVYDGTSRSGGSGWAKARIRCRNLGNPDAKVDAPNWRNPVHSFLGKRHDLFHSNITIHALR